MYRFLPLACLALACSPSLEDVALERTSSLASPIIKGTPSPAEQDATVLVMHYDALRAGGGAASSCTGTLLAPRSGP